MDGETALAAELLEIAKATKRIGPESIFRRRQWWFMTDEKFHEIDPKVHEKYIRLLPELLKCSGSEKRFSLETLDNMVKQSIANLVDGQATTESAVSELHGLLTTLSATQPEQAVLYELPGITLPVRTRPYTIAGARVTRFSTRDYSSLAKRCRATCSAVSKKTREQAYSALFKPHLDRLKGKTVVWCSYAAEPTRAQELSLETLRWVTILLEYGCMALRRDSAEMAIGISLVPRLEYFIIPKEGDSITSGGQLTGKYGSWSIVSSDRVQMRKAGVFALSDILEKSDNGTLPHKSFQAALLQAFQWAVTSLDQTTNSSKMLALTIALETLFSYNAPNVRSSIAEGTAMVILHNPAERDHICQRMKKFYDERCGVAHGRNQDEIPDSDVHEMVKYVTSVISTLCRHVSEFDSLDDFSEALSAAKLSGRVFKGR